MARVTSFLVFFRKTFSSYTSIPDTKHRSYYKAKPASFSTSFGYTSDKTHNQNINVAIQTLTRRCQSRRQFLQLQAHIVTTGLFRHPFPASHILKLSVDFAQINHTILIFREIRSPDTFCVNTVLKAYSLHLPYLASVFYFRMLANGFRPNSFTFPPLLVACVNSMCVKDGLKCHAHSVRFGVNNVLPVQNSLIHMYATLGHIHLASRLFDDMSERDVVSWNTIIHGYITLGDVKSAHCIFDKMSTKNVISWNIMISGYLNKARNPGCGLKLFREMTMMGFRGSSTTFVSVLTACGRSARLKEGRSIHASLIRFSVNSSLIIGTALVDMYGKCQRVEVARKVFDSMPVKNLVSWNAMILGYCIHGCLNEGISLFDKMVEKCDSNDDTSRHALLPDEVTFIGVLCACARGGLLLRGRDYFNKMLSVYNIKPKFAHYWCMANLYNGVGLILEAEDILRSMPEDENGSSEPLMWSGLLGSCRFKGDIELGERIAMRLIELDPQNGFHYSLLLIIYAVAGRWENVAKVKAMMGEKLVGKICDSRLVDLNKMVHEFAVENNSSRPGMDEVYSMLGELVLKLNLPTSKFTSTIEGT